MTKESNLPSADGGVNIPTSTTNQQQVAPTSGPRDVKKNELISGQETKSTAKVANAKPNGLKNRIIQRPPPLILDKVSNFYDNNQENEFVPIKTNTATVITDDQRPTSFNSNKQQQQYNRQHANLIRQEASKFNTNMTNSETNTNSANHKFWASLNRNVSRAKANANRVNSLDNSGQIDAIDSGCNLGADLIITHRDSNGKRDTSSTCILQAPMATQSHNFLQEKRQKQTTSGANSSTEDALERKKNETIRSEILQVGSALSAVKTDELDRETPISPTKTHDMSNLSSELDDGGAVSENGTSGGNLIGVDNPPTPTPLNIADDLPASATSSRPRSNNPFLAMDDDFVPQTSPNSNTFHKRPASFIAATEKGQRIIQSIDSNNYSGDKQATKATKQQQQEILTQLNEFHISSDNTQMPHHLGLFPHETNNDINAYERDSVYVGSMMMNQHQQDLKDNTTSTPLYRPVAISSSQASQHQLHNQQHTQLSIPTSQQSYPQQHPQQARQHQSVFDIQSQNTSYNSQGEPTISIDSESTVCLPPPSATMQLPYWTDAIYELNNAILETRSVAGGAENGQFIHILESGDIILELDRVKVSGYTLEEFNGLLESRPVHLLNAVQTKHCHGLTTDLKTFLSQSFSKDSIERDLQNLIRENVYRRTIPCTTRPPKDGEVDGVDYHFLNKDQFVELNTRGILLECGMYGGHYYGTMRPMVNLDNFLLYGSIQPKNIPNDMCQPLTANHPAILPLLSNQKDNPTMSPSIAHGENLYENNESLKMHGINSNTMLDYTNNISFQNRPLPQLVNSVTSTELQRPSTIVAVDNEALPHGWERVIDQTHGTYYIDHITRHTQYERPYEVELTKGAMGFGFTLVEADDGLLLVRSIIPGGPAYASNIIRPGDILVSAVGVSVYGLAHTDVARLFSTFAVGDRIRLTFARSSYVVDTNLVPDEYLISNGTNGDLAITVNPNHLVPPIQHVMQQSPYISVNQEYELISVTLKRGDQGFGFKIGDSMAGQKVREIQNNDVCTNLKQGDIIMSLNGQDITKLTHKEVVERLKNCPAGKDVTLTVKRKKRFRSKTPIAMPSENRGEFSINTTPQRNCKTPSVDSLMLRRTTHKEDPASRALFTSLNQIQGQLAGSNGPQDRSLPITMETNPIDTNYVSLPQPVDQMGIYGVLPPTNQERLYYNAPTQPMSLPTNYNLEPSNLNHPYNQGTPPTTNSEGFIRDSITNSVNLPEAPLQPPKLTNVNALGHVSQYNSFMNDDKLMIMQMHQGQYPPVMNDPTSDYHQLPLYSNCDIAVHKQIPEPIYGGNYQCNYYANNEEIALQQMQYAGLPLVPQVDSIYQLQNPNQQQIGLAQPYNHNGLVYNFEDIAPNEPDECEYHQVDLDRESIDSNWGIRLIGGSEVGRAISIGSIVSGGAASKNGLLKPGDEIIAINGNNVVGATHQHVVELISACSNRASLVVRRKKFAEACEVILNKNSDEGFGFVIISSGNCALIGRIINGSPAERCKQLHVRDRIIAVNGKYITPEMHHPEIVNMIKECGSTLRLRIIPVDCYTVELIKSAPSDNFGFTMRGGTEYDGTPLYILRVAPNGLARDLLNVGDQIIEINGISTVGMTHQQAATIIKYSHPIVKLKLRRNYVTPPSLLVDSPRALQKFNQVTAEMKTVNQSATPTSFNNDCNHLLTVPIES